MADIRLLGQSMDLVIDGEVLACAKSFSLQISSQNIEITNPDDTTWRNSKRQMSSWSIQASHIYTPTWENLQTIFQALSEGRTVSVIMRRSDLTGYQYFGDALIDSLNLNAGLDEPIGFNFAMSGKGKLNAEEILFVLGDENGDFLVDENADFLIG